MGGASGRAGERADGRADRLYEGRGGASPVLKLYDTIEQLVYALRIPTGPFRIE